MKKYKVRPGIIADKIKKNWIGYLIFILIFAALWLTAYIVLESGGTIY